VVSRLGGLYCRGICVYRGSRSLSKKRFRRLRQRFFQRQLKDFTGLFQKDTLQTVVGKALKEFLQLVQQELEDAEVCEEQLKQYIKPLNQFINNKSVKELLGSAFQCFELGKDTS